MKHLFAPYEISLELKKLGFRERCLASYGFDGLLKIKGDPYKNDYELDSGKCSAPLYQQVVDFLESKGIYIHLQCFNPKWDWYLHQPEMHKSVFTEEGVFYENKYEALNAAIVEAIKLIKNNV